MRGRATRFKPTAEYRVLVECLAALLVPQPENASIYNGEIREEYRVESQDHLHKPVSFKRERIMACNVKSAARAGHSGHAAGGLGAR